MASATFLQNFVDEKLAGQGLSQAEKDGIFQKYVQELVAHSIIDKEVLAFATAHHNKIRGSAQVALAHTLEQVTKGVLSKDRVIEGKTIYQYVDLP